MARGAYNMAKKLATFVNTEVKHFDVTTTTTALDDDGSVTSIIDSMTQGDTDSTRDGDGVRIQHIKLQGHVSAADQVAVVRVILFVDKQNTITAVNSFLEGQGDSNAPYEYRNWDLRFRGKTLYDKTFRISGSTAQSIMPIDVDIDCTGQNLHTQWEAGGTTVNTNNIKLLLVSGTASVSTIGAHIHSRIKYIDS